MKYKNQNPIDKLHDGEPYFFIRAQDVHSSFTVRQYAQTVGVIDQKAKTECLKIADAMDAWQEENPDKVKIPD